MQNYHSQKDEENISSQIVHSVSIRDDLPHIEKSYPDETREISPPNQFWLNKLKQLNPREQLSSSEIEQSIVNYEIHYSVTNGPYTSFDDHHPILTAFLRAYNSHEDVVLSPDDIWLMICIYFAKYINDHSNVLNDVYVNNQENKILTIENDQAEETDWQYFLHNIRLEMSSHVKSELCHLLTDSFSTTTNVQSLLSSLVMMSTFKKCFGYNSSFFSCGIRRVEFLGTLNDWIDLRHRANELQKWTKENDDFHLYIRGILPILDQFIQTYRGNVENSFWDQIFDLEHHENKSTQSDEMNINGWFLRLCYGHHQQSTCCIAHLKLNSLIVPVTVDNEHTNTSKKSFILGGFHGVDSFSQKHKPALSLLIVDDITSVVSSDK